MSVLDFIAKPLKSVSEKALAKAGVKIGAEKVTETGTKALSKMAESSKNVFAKLAEERGISSARMGKDLVHAPARKAAQRIVDEAGHGISHVGNYGARAAVKSGRQMIHPVVNIAERGSKIAARNFANRVGNIMPRAGSEIMSNVSTRYGAHLNHLLSQMNPVQRFLFNFQMRLEYVLSRFFGFKGGLLNNRLGRFVQESVGGGVERSALRSGKAAASRVESKVVSETIHDGSKKVVEQEVKATAEQASEVLTKQWKNITKGDLKVGDRIRILKSDGKVAPGNDFIVKAVKDDHITVEFVGNAGKEFPIYHFSGPIQRLEESVARNAGEQVAKDVAKDGVEATASAEVKKVAEESARETSETVGKQDIRKDDPFALPEKLMKRLESRPKELAQWNMNKAAWEGIKEQRRAVDKLYEAAAKSTNLRESAQLTKEAAEKSASLQKQAAEVMQKHVELAGRLNKTLFRQGAEKVVQNPKQFLGWSGAFLGGSMAVSGISSGKGALDPFFRVLFGQQYEQNGLGGVVAKTVIGEKNQQVVADKLSQLGQKTGDAVEENVPQAVNEVKRIYNGISDDVSAINQEGGDLYRGIKGAVTGLYQGNQQISDGQGGYYDSTTQQYVGVPQNGSSSQYAMGLARNAMDSVSGGNVSKMDLGTLIAASVLGFGRFGLFGKALGAVMAGSTIHNINKRGQQVQLSQAYTPSQSQAVRQTQEYNASVYQHPEVSFDESESTQHSRHM